MLRAGRSEAVAQGMLDMAVAMTPFRSACRCGRPASGFA